MAGPKQHFVPQYYLKGFAHKKRLFVYDKNREALLSEKSISVRDVGYKKHLYKINPNHISRYLREETNDPLYIDNLLNEYNEKISAPLIQSFIRLGDYVFKTKQTKLISIIRPDDILDFLTVQLFRTPTFREQFTSTAKLYEVKIRKDTLLDENPTFDELERVIHGVYLVSAIESSVIYKNTKKPPLLKDNYRFINNEVGEITAQLKSLNATLFVSSVFDCFVTSDRPIVFKRDTNGNAKTVILPLTKRCSFVYSRIQNADRAVVVIADGTKQLIRNQNSEMLNWAKRFVYSSSNPPHFRNRHSL